MSEDATPAGRLAPRLRLVAWVAIGVVVVGVFSTWTKAGPVTLNGIQGPNDGWLVVILSVPTVFWARMMGRASWSGAIGVLGVLGAALVMGWTAVQSWTDNRDVLDASVGYGLLLVLGGSVVLAVLAIVRGAMLMRPAPSPSGPEAGAESHS